MRLFLCIIISISGILHADSTINVKRSNSKITEYIKIDSCPRYITISVKQKAGIYIAGIDFGQRGSWTVVDIISPKQFDSPAHVFDFFFNKGWKLKFYNSKADFYILEKRWMRSIESIATEPLYSDDKLN